MILLFNDYINLHIDLDSLIIGFDLIVCSYRMMLTAIIDRISETKENRRVESEVERI